MARQAKAHRHVVDEAGGPCGGIALPAQMDKQIGKVRLYAIEDQRAGGGLIAQRGDEITRHVAAVDGQCQRLGADHGVVTALGAGADSVAVGMPSDSSNS